MIVNRVGGGGVWREQTETVVSGGLIVGYGRVRLPASTVVQKCGGGGDEDEGSDRNRDGDGNDVAVGRGGGGGVFG